MWLQALCSVVAGKSTACRLLPGMKESPLRGMEYFEGYVLFRCGTATFRVLHSRWMDRFRCEEQKNAD